MKTLVVMFAMLLAAPLAAAMFYVPVPAANGGQVELRVHSPGAKSFVSWVFVPAGYDGTKATLGTALKIPPKTTVTVTIRDFAPNGAAGLVMVDVDGPARVAAALVFSGGREIELPAISEGVAEPVYLVGLDVLPGFGTRMLAVNLEPAETHCQVSATKRGGTLVPGGPFTLPPLSSIEGGSLGDYVTGSDVTASIVCQAAFYALAIVGDGPEAGLVLPAVGSSATGPPPPPPPPPPAAGCRTGALIDQPGQFHAPAVGHELFRRVVETVPGEQLRALHLTMDFTFGGWNPCADCIHSVFWLQRTAGWPGNVFGYLNLFGPNKNLAKNLTNADLPPGETVFKTAKFFPAVGETYSVDYTYVAGGAITTIISNAADHELARIVDHASAPTITTSTDWQLVVGHEPTTAGREVPTYGWHYENLCFWVDL